MQHLWIEPELAHIANLIAAIDEYLLGICDAAVAADDADNLGHFDNAEHAVGLGLVACQTYMATAYGALKIEKSVALTFGLRHHGGLTQVQIINHAANYWKHNNEWSLDRSAARKEAIKRAFESIGFPIDTDYPLSGVLVELSNPAPPSLKQVVRALETWKKEMCETCTKSRGSDTQQGSDA